VDAFRIIVFAADFSANAAAAFRVTCSLSVERATRLIVLHVIEPDWAAKKPEYARPGLAAAARTEGLPEFLKRRLSELYVPVHPLDVQYRTTEGHAATEIVRVADAAGANLIAMGTHGRSGLPRLLTGSVAAQVLATAHCPVLALRTGAAEPKGTEVRVILHPTDFSQASETACGVARLLARDHGARLVLLHVAPIDVYLEARFAAELDPADRGAALDAMRQKLDGPDLKQPVGTSLARGDAAQEICRVAQNVAADLIVMGSRGRTGLGRFLMGNTAETVLSRALAPVLVVKPSPPEPAAAGAEATQGVAIAR
jgi:nucleotide-binding universal stress UspA family protein